MTDPRGIQARIDWFLSHDASASGMCAQHSWHSLGGDYGNPPAWGCSDANEVYDKVKASGRYWTGTPKKGALVLWKYGNNGHAAICYDDAGTKIATTNPTNDAPNGRGTGVEPIGYPSKWGASSSARIYTDQYNGVRFSIGSTSISHGEVYLSKLKYGQQDSDSVERLQMHLNAHKLEGGHDIVEDGDYGEQTDVEVRLCQDQHLPPADAAGKSFVGPTQAEHLFTNCACTIINDTEPEEPEAPPVTAGGHYWFSGKPAGTLTVTDSYKRLDVDKWAPPVDGLLMSMLYLNVSVETDTEFRVRLIRDPDDATAYQTYYAVPGDSFLLTHVWFEMGEKGRPLWWEISCSDSNDTLKINTRYAKFATVKQP